MFINKQKGNENKDLSYGRTLEYYLELTKNFKHKQNERINCNPERA